MFVDCQYTSRENIYTCAHADLYHYRFQQAAVSNCFYLDWKSVDADVLAGSHTKRQGVTPGGTEPSHRELTEGWQ